MVKQIYPQPCIRCGACCRAEICHPAQLLLPGVSPPCPALEGGNGEYRCGLVADTARYVYPGKLSKPLYEQIRSYLLEKFEFGVGCDSKLRRPDAEARPAGHGPERRSAGPGRPPSEIHTRSAKTDNRKP